MSLLLFCNAIFMNSLNNIPMLMYSKQQFLEQQHLKQEQSFEIRRQQELSMISRSVVVIS
jgi:hypothetical protein